jgi:hypothetical protein
MVSIICFLTVCLLMEVLSDMMMFRTNNMVRALQAPLVGPSRDWAIRPIRAGGLLTQPTNYIIIY